MKLLSTFGMLASVRAALTGYDGQKQLSSGSDFDYKIYWSVTDQNINLGIEYATTDPSPWVGFGLSPSGGMAGADIMLVTGGNDVGAPVQVTDRKAGGFFEPALDERTQSDWTLVSQALEGGVWAVEVRKT